MYIMKWVRIWWEMFTKLIYFFYWQVKLHSKQWWEDMLLSSGQWTVAGRTLPISRLGSKSPVRSSTSTLFALQPSEHCRFSCILRVREQWCSHVERGFWVAWKGRKARSSTLWKIRCRDTPQMRSHWGVLSLTSVQSASGCICPIYVPFGKCTCSRDFHS